MVGTRRPAPPGSKHGDRRHHAADSSVTESEETESEEFSVRDAQHRYRVHRGYNGPAGVINEKRDTIDLSEVYGQPSTLFGHGTNVGKERTIFQLFYVLALISLISSAVLYGFAESYLRAYFAEEGIITEEQDKFVDIAKASQLIGACSIALALIASLAEFCAQRSNTTNIATSLAGKTRRKEPGGGRMRLILWTLIALALTIAFIVYATRMWREGTHPEIKQNIKFKGKKGRIKVKTKLVRKTCKKAKFSHCDKLEDIGEGLIAAGVTQGLVLLLLLGMLFMIQSGSRPPPSPTGDPEKHYREYHR